MSGPRPLTAPVPAFSKAFLQKAQLYNTKVSVVRGGFMRSISKLVLVDTCEKQQLLNLTSSVRQAVDAAGIQSGFVGVYSQHTTASVFVTECQAALTEDVVGFFQDVVPEGL